MGGTYDDYEYIITYTCGDYFDGVEVYWAKTQSIDDSFLDYMNDKIDDADLSDYTVKETEDDGCSASPTRGGDLGASAVWFCIAFFSLVVSDCRGDVLQRKGFLWGMLCCAAGSFPSEALILWTCLVGLW